MLTIDITSALFLVFMLFGLLVYYFLPKGFQWCWLLFLSVLFFVLACGFVAVPYLLFGVLVTYAGARLLERSPTEGRRKAALIVTLVLTLIELFLLKDLTSLLGAVTPLSVFGVKPGGQAFTFAAPIGMTYYTLSVLGYVLDVYWKTQSAQKNLLKHMLFVCWFPQLTSGPITRYGDMKDALFQGCAFDSGAVLSGLQRMLWGYFKKFVVADRAAALVAAIYDGQMNYPGFYVAVGVLFYAFQLYADFSGCMDIVLGASEAFGVGLPENFNSPFSSESMAEFWRRWHITLGAWFKDYLLYPLLKSTAFQKLGAACRKRFGKSVGKRIPTYLGLMAVWFCIGLWHGGSAKYMVAAGAIPCVYLIAGDALQPVFHKLAALLNIKMERFSFRLFRKFRTLVLFLVIVGVARAGTLSDAPKLLESMFSSFNPWIFFDDSLLKLGLGWKELALLFVSLLLMLGVGVMHGKGIKIRRLLAQQNIVFRWLVMLAAIFAVLIFGVYGPNYKPVDFIYGGF